MKSYEEMAKNVLERRDEYNKAKAQRAKMARGAAITAVCLCISVGIGIGGWTAVNQKNDGHGDLGNAPDLPPVYESEVAETDGYTDLDPDSTDVPDTSKTPTADPVIDTTPGHDVEQLPIEIPDGTTIIHIPSSSGALQDINISLKTADLLETADLVLIGEYLGTENTTVNEYLHFISHGKVKIAEVLKGEVDADEPIEVSFTGGQMTVAQVLSKVPGEIPEERLANYGWLSMTKEEQETFVVQYMVGGADWELEEGKYLFFLMEGEEGYYICCDMFGAREINSDGKAYNPDTRLYEDIPVLYRYASLDEAKGDATYCKYLPEYIPAGFWVESIKHFDVGEQDNFSALWSRGYDDISWKVSKADEYSDSRRTSTADTVNYDLSLYPIPRAETVPEELMEIVDNPVFDADEVTLEVIYRRAYKVDDSGDTDGYRINFSIQTGDIIIEIRTKGITPEELYAMLGDIIG